MKSATGVQGLWKSDTNSELSLVTTSGGALVGVYRLAAPHGSKEYPLSGHAVGDWVAFSVPFADHGAIACWCGTLAEDSRGLRLDIARRLVGEAVGESQTEGVDIFRPVRPAIGAAPEPAKPGVPRPRAATP